MPAQLALVRHAPTKWNAERRFQGHADTTLSDEGRAEARALGEKLKSEPVTAIYTSPLRRAVETADIVSEALGVPAQIEERLREIDVGSWQGLTREEVEARFPDAYRRWIDGDAPWEEGESYDALAERVVPALVELAERHSDGLVVAITHGGPVRVALRAAGGPKQAPGSVENASIVRLAVREGNIEPVD